MSNKDKSFIGILIIFFLILAYQQIQISKLERVTKNIDIYSVEYDIRDIKIKLDTLERELLATKTSASSTVDLIHTIKRDISDLEDNLSSLESYSHTHYRY